MFVLKKIYYYDKISYYCENFEWKRIIVNKNLKTRKLHFEFIIGNR